MYNSRIDLQKSIHIKIMYGFLCYRKNQEYLIKINMRKHLPKEQEKNTI